MNAKIVRIVTMNQVWSRFTKVVEYTHWSDGTQTRREWLEYFG